MSFIVSRRLRSQPTLAAASPVRSEHRLVSDTGVKAKHTHGIAGRAAGHLSEQQIHQTVVAHLRMRGVPGLVFIHCPNGGFRRRTEAAIFKGLGVRAGVADLLLWHDGRFYALELKTPGGRPSEAQLAFLADFERAGGFTAVTDDLDRAIATLQSWNLLGGVRHDQRSQ